MSPCLLSCLFFVCAVTRPFAGSLLPNTPPQSYCMDNNQRRDAAVRLTCSEECFDSRLIVRPFQHWPSTIPLQIMYNIPLLNPRASKKTVLHYSTCLMMFHSFHLEIPATFFWENVSLQWDTSFLFLFVLCQTLLANDLALEPPPPTTTVDFTSFSPVCCKRNCASKRRFTWKRSQSVDCHR